MTDYKEMYFFLFNKITDTIQDLQKMQQHVEEMYLSQENSEIRIHELSTKKKTK